MDVQDLGKLEGPVLLFGGPYSNLHATEALIAWAAARGIAPDHMICTGDIVAYCGAPAGTVAALRGLGCAVVAGNCERQLADYAMDCGCGFDAGSTCDLLSAGWYAHADKAIGAGDRAWMGGLPDVITFEQAGRRAAVIHGGATDISRFIWPVSPDDIFLEEIEHLRAAIGPVQTVIAGHCGMVFERNVDGVLWVNAGVIGMPPHDGAPETRFVVMQDGQPQGQSLPNDHERAAAEMRAAGLTQGYDSALLSGYWPSEEVLPPELRRSALASG